MQHNHLVSVIMPSYNSARFIAESIESVINQTYKSWELLITDDCSTDNTVEIVKRYTEQDDRIKLFVLEKNSGVGVARNNSIAKAQGRFIAFLDSDDIWKPNKLETQLSFMIKNDYAFTTSDYEVIKEDGSPTNKIIHCPKYLNYHQYLRNTNIGCLTVIIDRETVGDFRMPIIKSSQDMALWLLIMKRGFKVYGLKKNLATYRLVSNSNTAKKRKAAKDVWKVYRQFEHLSIIYSCFCFVGYGVNAMIKRL